MLHEKIILDKENSEVYIETYVESDGSARDAILVIPGGGYAMVCHEREGAPIANAFLSRGINAFVLNYRVGEGKTYPTQLTDAARAIAYIKKNADRYGVNPDRVFTVGFSAGGHLVGTIATQHSVAEKLLGLPENFARPRGSIYAYPVVSAMCPTHGSSFHLLAGKRLCTFTEEEKRLYSLEYNVTPDTPPAFIWHTATDELVPVYGSLRLAEAYVKAGVRVALHIYPYGPHGLALANETTRCDNDNLVQPLAEGWVDYAVEFMKTV